MIHLDLRRGEIRFCINDIDHGVAFTNIKQNGNIKYRVFVKLYWTDAKAKIIQFRRM